MLKDPLLSSAIHLKPPDQVWAASALRAAKKKPTMTIDGVPAAASYRAREQGHRS